jgi:hypothetical protein
VSLGVRRQNIPPPSGDNKTNFEFQMKLNFQLKEKNKLQPFLKYTPFPTKKREFTYTTENAGTKPQETLIKGLGSTENYNTNNKTWNDEISADVYVSKVKFN